MVGLTYSSGLNFGGACSYLSFFIECDEMIVIVINIESGWYNNDYLSIYCNIKIKQLTINN